MRVLREPRDIVAVIHAVVGGRVEIRSVPAAGRPHLGIARRVEVAVVHREQERVRGREREAERLDSEDGRHAEGRRIAARRVGPATRASRKGGEHLSIFIEY